MPVNDITATRGYQLPHATNNLDHDVARLRSSFSAIDADVAGLLTSVAGKAAVGHAHVISDVSGLQSALDGVQPSQTILNGLWCETRGAPRHSTSHHVHHQHHHRVLCRRHYELSSMSPLFC